GSVNASTSPWSALLETVAVSSPAAIVLPSGEMATGMYPPSPGVTVISAVWVAGQAPLCSANTYAAPFPLAPETIVVPLVASVYPSSLLVAPSEAVMILLVVELAQPVDGSVNTNTAPCPVLL